MISIGCVFLLTVTAVLLARSLSFSPLSYNVFAYAGDGRMTTEKQVWGSQFQERKTDFSRFGVSKEGKSDERIHSPDKMKDLFVLGVCGGIASGKSKACQILTTSPPTNDDATSSISSSPPSFDQGRISVVGHIDMDKVAHSIYAPGSPIINELAAAFGSSIITSENTIDRAALGSIVFSDKSKLSKLESLVWPHLKEKLLKHLLELQESVTKITSIQQQLPAVAVVEAAMLLEAGWDDMLDAVWVVRTPREVALERMTCQRKMDRSEALKRLDAQATRRGMSPESLSDACKQGVVSAVIVNDSDKIGDLTRQLQKAWNDPKCWKEGCCPQNFVFAEETTPQLSEK